VSRLRVISLRACTLLTAILVTACGGSGSELDPRPRATTGGGGDDAAGGAGGTGGEQGGAGNADTGGAAPTSLLPPLDIVDEPDTDCASIGAVGLELLAPEEVTAPFDRLVRIGAHRAAGGSLAGGAFTFEADSGKAAPFVALDGSYNVMASEGDRLGLLAQSDAGIVYGRFDTKGKQMGALLDVAPELPANLAIGAGGGEALAVWGVPGRMRARGIGVDGSLGEMLEFGAGTIDNYFTASVAQANAGFAVAWTGNATPTEFRTLFMTTFEGGLGPVHELVDSTVSHRVVKLARTPTGFALLVNVDSVPPTPVVVILDPTGAVVGEAHRFLGATYGWDLAVLDDELGLVARRASGEIAFRPLDGQGAPLAPWRCVTAPSDDLYQQAAIDGDDAGYAILHRTPEGAESLSIVDRLGSSVDL
jgi:hypothetical protein